MVCLGQQRSKFKLKLDFCLWCPNKVNAIWCSSIYAFGVNEKLLEDQMLNDKRKIGQLYNNLKNTCLAIYGVTDIVKSLGYSAIYKLFLFGPFSHKMGATKYFLLTSLYCITNINWELILCLALLKMYSWLFTWSHLLFYH